MAACHRGYSFSLFFKKWWMRFNYDNESYFLEGSAGSLLSTTGSFRTSLLQTTDLEYKRVSRQYLGLGGGPYFTHIYM